MLVSGSRIGQHRGLQYFAKASFSANTDRGRFDDEVLPALVHRLRPDHVIQTEEALRTAPEVETLFMIWPNRFTTSLSIPTAVLYAARYTENFFTGLFTSVINENTK